MTTLICPECESDRVTVGHVETFMVNTGDFFCHSIKTHDDVSPSTCLDCWWQGTRVQLKVQEQ
jgi:hypothetical protein